MHLFILVDDPVTGRTGMSLVQANGQWSGAVSTPLGRPEPVAIPGGLCLDEAVNHVVFGRQPRALEPRPAGPDAAA